jgi:ATP-dependent DNA helicase HFM1/MER3
MYSQSHIDVLSKAGQGYCEMSELNVTQMIGRAGRPQFDESGIAVIMTQESTVAQYENLISRKELVESKLVNNSFSDC